VFILHAKKQNKIKLYSPKEGLDELNATKDKLFSIVKS
jgi:hypothetical protein